MKNSEFPRLTKFIAIIPIKIIKMSFNFYCFRNDREEYVMLFFPDVGNGDHLSSIDNSNVLQIKTKCEISRDN